MNKNKIEFKKWEETMSCIRTLQWRGNWINRHENKIDIKKILILILNFEFNLI